jgi:hypothetical protein
MRRLIGALVFSLAMFCVERAQACKCGSTPAENFARADVVFRGRALGPSLNPYPIVRDILLHLLRLAPRDWSNYLAFSVSGVWKGNVSSRIVVSTDPSSCGAYFVTGEEYVVFAEGDKHATSLCSGNVAVDGSTVAGLGTPKPPAVSVPAWLVLLALAGGTALVLLGIRDWRQRRGDF